MHTSKGRLLQALAILHWLRTNSKTL